jgi:hypothetical protein
MEGHSIVSGNFCAGTRLAVLPLDGLDQGRIAELEGRVLSSSTVTRLARTYRVVTVAVVAGALAACASVDVQTTEYVGAPRYQPTVPNSVQILRTEPTVPHDRLGEIVVDASTDPAPPVTEIERKLVEAAAKMGANAVVVVLDRVQPVAAYVTGPWWGRSVESVSGRKVIGVAIRFRR